MDMKDQASFLRRQLNQEQKEKTIAIVSGKVGVGKSNIALIFSIKLLVANKKVLLIDLDIGMGNIDILIGKSSSYSLADLFSHSKTLHDIKDIGPKVLAYIAGGNSFHEFLE